MKTVPNENNVQEFLAKVENDQKREDSFAILTLMQEAVGESPTMWGTSIIGFGSYHYVYASGREGDYFLSGFSPRKQNLTLYIMSGFDQYEDLLSKLGKHKLGKSCLYIKKLADVDQEVLSELVKRSAQYVAAQYA